MSFQLPKTMKFPKLPKVIEGEIEVGHEATVLLQSHEEECAEVLRVSPERMKAGALIPRPRSIEEEQTAKVKRALGIRDFYEEDMERNSSFDQTDEQLADVLYAVCYLHLPPSSLLEHPILEDQPVEGAVGGMPAGGLSGGIGLRVSSSLTSLVTVEGSVGGAGGSSGCCPYSKQELQKTLREIFDVDDATIETMYQEIRRRERPQVTLHLRIIEAKDLRPKTSKGTCHPYCVVRTSESEATLRTPVLPNTLTPSWNCELSLSISDIQDSRVTVEVWHQPEESSMKQLAAIQNFNTLSRTVLGGNEFKNLLGSVTVPLESIKNRSSQSWYNLVKKEEVRTVSLRESFRLNKKRGSLHLGFNLSVKSQLNLLGYHWYDILLTKTLQNQLGFHGSFGNFGHPNVRSSGRSAHNTFGSVGSTCTASSGTGSSYETETASSSTPTAPWAGTISSTEAYILSQYGAILNMTPPLVTLSWWKFSSKHMGVDQSYLGDLLKKLLHCINQGEYSEEEMKEVKSYLKLWASFQDEKLMNLHMYFPTSTRVISHIQLTHTLRNLKLVEVNAQSHPLNVFPRDTSYSAMVTDAVTYFTKNWWEKTLKNCGRDSPRATDEQQLEAVVVVTGEVLSFFREVRNFYEAVFKNEADLSYLKMSYILLSNELAARIRPLLLRIYETPVKPTRCKVEKSPSERDSADMRAMDEKTPVWQLYKKLECICMEIGDKLSKDTQEQSGIKGYHRWFMGAVKRWLEQMHYRAKALLIDEVKKDKFEEFKKKCNATSSTSESASEVSYIFHIVKTHWLKLAWPKEEDGDFVANQLLEKLCSLGTLYAKQVINKMDNTKKEGTTVKSYTLSVQNCIALNNIEYLRQEIIGLPDLLQLNKEGNIQHGVTIVNKTLKKMESLILQFISGAVKKIQPDLTQAVATSCDMANEMPLLNEVLDGELCHLKRHLDEANLQRILLNLWRTLVHIFQDIVKRSSDRRKAEYFNGVYNVLDRTWHFFTPIDHSGLDPQAAYTSEYGSLKNDLSNLKLSTELLIAKYYRQRYEEQQKRETLSVADLIVHVYFTRTDKLYVEVIMARNINECGNTKDVRNPLAGKNSGPKQLDTYVQVRLIPSDWFPNMSRKTKTQKKEMNPVFQESFEFNVSAKDHGATVGILHFTLKTSLLVQADGFLGEAVLPLDAIPCVDFTGAKTVPSYLSVNLPKAESDYSVIKALKFRNWDKKAVAFLKELKELRRKKSVGS